MTTARKATAKRPAKKAAPRKTAAKKPVIEGDVLDPDHARHLVPAQVRGRAAPRNNPDADETPPVVHAVHHRRRRPADRLPVADRCYSAGGHRQPHRHQGRGEAPGRPRPARSGRRGRDRVRPAEVAHDLPAGSWSLHGSRQTGGSSSVQVVPFQCLTRDGAG